MREWFGQLNFRGAAGHCGKEHCGWWRNERIIMPFRIRRTIVYLVWKVHKNWQEKNYENILVIYSKGSLPYLPNHDRMKLVHRNWPKLVKLAKMAKIGHSFDENRFYKLINNLYLHIKYKHRIVIRKCSCVINERFITKKFRIITTLQFFQLFFWYLQFPTLYFCYGLHGD